MSGCLEIFGGMGLTTDLPIKKFWRDMRSMMITEGLEEILRMSLAREVLRQALCGGCYAAHGAQSARPA